MAYRHIVIFKLKENIAEETIQQALAVLNKLGEQQTGITQWVITESLDTRKGRVIIEDSTFDSEASFIGFKTSESHKQAGEFMSKISDWVVGDYVV